MTDKQALAIAESVAHSTDNEAVREAMLGAARYLEQKAATERVNRQVFVLALGALFAALMRL